MAGVSVAPAGAQEAGGVLVAGDSLEVGTGPYLQGELAGTPVTVDAVEGRTSGEILDALRTELASSNPAVVVFDAGTNDDPASPDVLAANLQAAGQAAGGRCMVVATINRPPYNGYGPQGLNAAISSFAASRPGTLVADWQSLALAHPEIMNSDGVHPTSDGYALRAQLIARSVRSCLAGGAAPPAPAQPKEDEPPPPSPAQQHARVAYLVLTEALGRLADQARGISAGTVWPAAVLFGTGGVR